MIRVENLRKEYEGAVPLKNVSVTINDGDVISVIGPSGTGKSTFLRCLNLLEKPSGGRIWIDDDEITSPQCNIDKVRLKVGMVFQSVNLFEHLTVIENIMLSPVTLLKKKRQEAFDRGMELLKTVGLSQKAFCFQDELSGGQRQRAAIARTLAMDPEIILMDEPTSALDPSMVFEVQSVIRELSKSGRTMIIVTHEMNFARAICNRIFYMDEGGIYEDGTPDEIFDSPKRDKTRIFVHKLKVLEITADGKEYDYPAMQSKIRNYCEKNQISRLKANHIELCFEEIIGQNLLKALENPKIRATVEYSAEDEETVFIIEYPGGDYDPLKNGDPVSLSIINGIIEEPEYKRSDSPNYDCQLRFTVK